MSAPAVSLRGGLPSSLDAERSLLGGILLDPIHLSEVRGYLAKSDFAIMQHQEIFGAMVAIEDQQRAVDIITLRQELADQKRIEAVGGIAYIASLTENMPRRPSLTSYIEIIREKASLRRLAYMAQEAMTRVGEGETSPEIISQVQSDLERILDGSEEMQDPLIGRTIGQTFTEIAAERRGDVKRPVVSLGLKSLDEFTGGGMRHGEVTVVGARSGVGKSSLMIQAAVANAKAGRPVHLFSQEMTRQQVEQRILAIEAKVPFKHVNRVILDDDEEFRLCQAAERIAEWPLRIHDKSDMHIDQIVGLARLSIRRYGTEFVAVDYAQTVSADGKDERTRVGSVSQKLTSMIKHEAAALMLLSQLRKVEREHYSKPPIILDLMETGKLENNAHCVLLLHRGWDEEQSRISDDAQIIVAKQRRGDVAPLEYRFSRRSVTFEER